MVKLAAYSAALDRRILCDVISKMSNISFMLDIQANETKDKIKDPDNIKKTITCSMKFLVNCIFIFPNKIKIDGSLNTMYSTNKVTIPEIIDKITILNEEEIIGTKRLIPICFDNLLNKNPVLKQAARLVEIARLAVPY